MIAMYPFFHDKSFYGEFQNISRYKVISMFVALNASGRSGSLSFHTVRSNVHSIFLLRASASLQCQRDNLASADIIIFSLGRGHGSVYFHMASLFHNIGSKW